MLRVLLPALLLGIVILPAAAQQPAATPAPAAPPQPPAPNVVAATVNGQAIPALAVFRALQNVPPVKHAEARVEIVNFLIENALLDQFLKSQNIAIDAKAVDARIAEMQEQMKKQNLEFAKMLQQMMMTEAELRDHIAAEMRWDKYISTQATDAVLQDMFTKNVEMFDGSMVHARHILMPKPANNGPSELVAIRAQLEAQVAQAVAKLPPTADALTKQKERAKVLDEAFAAMAKQKSTCPSKEQGGDVGWFPRAGRMVEPFAAAAFALKPYELSEVVTTQFGQHLILCVDRKTGKEIKFAEAKDTVKEVYALRVRDNLVPQLRAKAKIEIADVK
jgi:peptidyl-prolyl cis-trans isomerase C